ncbi:uncharacterized protein LOC111696245 [Eurytemora carolleeae]|uniref:uncharacterized protein LOC111696245 n=1 Tax=Eurytemora carolleeae TaxID=1294199 RepID=UPI000C76BFB1|nr:uncharacterized protein LOC111696245 [Eurytemora carolleeae]|eukprot:XP_023321565.1 uncharacterized protein LOC111696245 [Eurytemora affinis]
MIRYNPTCSESSLVSRDPCSTLDSRSLDAYPPVQPWTNNNNKDTSGSGSKLNHCSEEAKTTSPLRVRPSIKQSLEQARLRRTQENRKSFNGEYNEDRFEEKQRARSKAKDESTLQEANEDLKTSRTRLLVEE